MKAIRLALILGGIIIFRQVVATETLIGHPSVIDGDTIEINDQRIRLHGIDAPEARQTCSRGEVEWLCGQEASKALRDALRNNPMLNCMQTDTDRYGRIVAKCFTFEGVDISGWMVSEGWALAYTRYSNDYVSAEDIAKARGLGLWAGEFQKPWAWRRR